MLRLICAISNQTNGFYVPSIIGPMTKNRRDTVLKYITTDKVYTDFINGGCARKNWYLNMKTRRLRINMFRFTSFSVGILQVSLLKSSV